MIINLDDIESNRKSIAKPKDDQADDDSDSELSAKSPSLFGAAKQVVEQNKHSENVQNQEKKEDSEKKRSWSDYASLATKIVIPVILFALFVAALQVRPLYIIRNAMTHLFS